MIWVPDFRLAQAIGAREASNLESALHALSAQVRPAATDGTGAARSGN